jgi:hypothetical protein
VRNRSILAILVCSLLLGLSPLAADPVIHRGIDVLTTPADGTTYFDFSNSPIPAGFFCKGAKAFTGRVTFKGLPLVTGTPGQLRDADTVVERLDDAVFDQKGIATTRIQIRALSLVSIAPIKTTCGSFHVYARLGGKQRVTTMSIYRTQEGGGNFVAPLAVNAHVTFVPVKPVRNKAARKLELTTNFTFPASSLPWSFTGGERASKIGPVIVDTNGDLSPDALLPGTSNFSPGSSPSSMQKISEWGECGCVCHYDPDHGQHCYFQNNGYCQEMFCPN